MGVINLSERVRAEGKQGEKLERIYCILTREMCAADGEMFLQREISRPRKKRPGNKEERKRKGE